MKKMRAFALCSLVLGSPIVVACAGVGEPIGPVPADDGVSSAKSTVRRPGGKHEQGRDEDRVKAETSPYVVGQWQFATDSSGNILADTEFVFLNPADNTVVLEYAFFEQPDLAHPDFVQFCGCDRDTLTANKQVTYTISGEQQGNLFNCTTRSGMLKSIVFKKKADCHDDDGFDLDGATQTGFESHVYALNGGSIREPDATIPGDFLSGPVMTRAGLRGVAITKATLADIEDIHEACVSFLGPVP
jgi:hypothetical protein